MASLVISIADMGIVALGVGCLARAAFVVHRFGAVSEVGRDTVPLPVLTAAIWALAGGWCAVAVYAKLSVLLAGVDAPVAAHVWVAAGALLAALVSAIVLRGSVRVLVLSAGLALVALTADSGLNYPARIVEHAEDKANGAARCLMLGQGLHAPESHVDLMAMTIGKAERGPSAVLLPVERGDGQDLFRWSFKGIRFTYPAGPEPDPACTPQSDPRLPNN